MERARALVYVIDLSAENPWEELGILRDELEKYQPGMSSKARIVVANKADLLAGDGDPSDVEKARGKLLAPKTATGPIGCSMRRMSGLGSGLRSGNAVAIRASSQEPSWDSGRGPMPILLHPPSDLQSAGIFCMVRCVWAPREECDVRLTPVVYDGEEWIATDLAEKRRTPHCE